MQSACQNRIDGDAGFFVLRQGVAGQRRAAGQAGGGVCEVSVSVFAHSSDAKKDSLKKQEGTVCVAKYE